MSDYLMHHGILGMKWGVRRYQNPDGTLTPAGRRKYYKNKPNGDMVLSKAGLKYNKKRLDVADRYKDATRYNTSKNG